MQYCLLVHYLLWHFRGEVRDVHAGAPSQHNIENIDRRMINMKEDRGILIQGYFHAIVAWLHITKLTPDLI